MTLPRWIKYDGYLKAEASKKLAAKLRASGKYEAVRIGDYVTDWDKRRYSKVYVKPKLELAQ